MVLAMVTAASEFSGTASESAATFRSVCIPFAFSSVVEATTVEAGVSESKGDFRSPAATSCPSGAGLDATPWAGEDEVSAPDGALTTEGGTVVETGGISNVSGCVPMKDAFSTCSRANLKQKYGQNST